MPSPPLSGSNFTVSAQSWVEGAPEVTFLLDGRAVVAWRSDGLADTLRYQVVNPDGTLWSNGSVSGLGVVAAGSGMPVDYQIGGFSLAGLGSGGFVVVWEDNQTVAGLDPLTNVWYQAYSIDPLSNGITTQSPGTTTYGGLVHTSYVGGWQLSPDVAGINGGFAITWQDGNVSQNGVTNPAGGWGVQLATFQNNGIPIGSTNFDMSDAWGGDVTPAVAFGPTNVVLTVWDDDLGNNAGSAPGIYMNVGGFGIVRLDRSNAATSNPAANSPDIAYDFAGNVLAVWNEGRELLACLNANPANLIEATYNYAGLNDHLTPVNTNPITGASGQFAVVGLFQGGFLLVWVRETDNEILGQMFDAAGNRVGGHFSVSVEAPFSAVITSVDASIMADGRVMVTWAEDGDIRAQIVDTAPPASIFTLGPDTVTLPSADGTWHALDGGDTVTGTSGADIIFGDAGNDRLDGLGGFDQLFGDAGNDTIVWDAADDLANVLGGADTDTLLVLSGAAPTGFDLASHGFEIGRVEATDTGGQSWASYYRLYAPGWAQTQQFTTYDNGTSIRIGYSGGLQDWQQEYRVDGTLQYYTDWDQALNQTWSQTVEYYAANGTTRTQKLTNYDNGTSIRVGYDAAGNPDWQQEMRANGTLEIYTDWDQAGNQTWTQTVEYYAADGATRTQKNTTYDNGTSIRVGYDVHGHADWQEERRADATLQYYTDWDQDAQVNWSYFIRYYGADGTTVTGTHIFYDNGTDVWV